MRLYRWGSLGETLQILLTWATSYNILYKQHNAFKGSLYGMILKAVCCNVQKESESISFC